MRHGAIARVACRAVVIACAAGDIGGHADGDLNVLAAFWRIAMAAVIATDRALAAFALETDFPLRATVSTADDPTRRAATLLAVAFAEAAGIVATLAVRRVAAWNRGIAAIGTTIRQRSWAIAGCSIPGLIAGAAHRFGGGCSPARGASGPGSGCARERNAPETKESLQQRAARLSVGQLSHERVETSVVHDGSSQTNFGRMGLCCAVNERKLPEYSNNGPVVERAI